MSCGQNVRALGFVYKLTKTAKYVIKNIMHILLAYCLCILHNAAKRTRQYVLNKTKIVDLNLSDGTC